MARITRKKAFTLVEVCLVMLVFAIAISTILAFFPVALRQGNSAVTDSVVTSFADYVLNSLQANAAKLKWDDWNPQGGDFRGKVIDGITIDPDGAKVPLRYNDGAQTIKKYLGVENSTIKYELDFYNQSESNDPKIRIRDPYKGRVWQITLYVTDNEHGSVRKGHVFVTHVVYLKEPEK